MNNEFDCTIKQGQYLALTRVMQLFHILPNKQKRPITESFHNFGGEGEIRTLGELPHDGFQDRYLKPLGHLSKQGTSNILTD